jgi:hypothetical protein
MAEAFHRVRPLMAEPERRRRAQRSRPEQVRNPMVAGSSLKSATMEDQFPADLRAIPTLLLHIS